jgi:hypothetical protein
MPNPKLLSLAEFSRQVYGRATAEPPCPRSPDLLVVALARVAASPATMRSRVLGRLLVALSRDEGDFGSTDIYALDGETLGLAAELVEGRLNGWYSQRDWDEFCTVIEAIDAGAACGGQTT